MTDTQAKFAEKFSGLTEDFKFLVNVPNGSIWRELDSGNLYCFNDADKTWYRFDSKFIVTDGTNDVSLNADGSFNVKDSAVRTNTLDLTELLNDILNQIKISNIHLSLLSDNKVTEKEVN